MALNYITSIFTGQSVFVETTTAGAPTATAARGSIAIINVSGAVEVYINDSVGTTGNSWALIGGGSASTVSYDPTRSGLVEEVTGAPATNVQQAIDAIATGQIVATFVFNPNVAADVGNVYKTWANLYRAFSRVPTPVRKVIQFIKANAGTTTITAGDYDFRNTEWIGDPASGLATPVYVVDGARVSPAGNARPPVRVSGLLLEFFCDTVPFCDLTTGANFLVFDDNTGLTSSGLLVPFVITDGSSTFTLEFRNGANIKTNTTALFGLTNAGAGNDVVLYDQSLINAGSLEAAVGQAWSIRTYGKSAFCSATQVGAGTFSRINYWNVPNFAPSVSADWAGDPASIQAAIDRLAAAVAGLLGGPIP